MKRKLMFMNNGRCIYFNQEEIVYVKASENYQEVYFLNRPMRRFYGSMDGLMNQFSKSKLFIRTHRSYFVNLNELLEMDEREVEILMSTYGTARISKSYVAAFKAAMNCKEIKK